MKNAKHTLHLRLVLTRVFKVIKVIKVINGIKVFNVIRVFNVTNVLDFYDASVLTLTEFGILMTVTN